MADEPGKDVFEDDDLDDQRVIDEAEEKEEREAAETAAAEVKDDDIEVVLAEEEKEGETKDGEEKDSEDDKQQAGEDAGDLALVPIEEKQDDEDDAKSYSKKVRDRIERERRLVKKAREEAEAAIHQERQHRIEAERRSLTAHKNLTDVLIVNLDGQIKAKSAELKTVLAAVATGDEAAPAKQVELQGELDDLRAKKREVDAAKTSLERQTEEFERQVKAAPVPRVTPEVTPATQAWLTQNRWFGRKGFAAETMFVRSLDNALAQERSDKGSPEYFRVLNQRIRDEIPDLADKVRRAAAPQDTRGKSAVAPVSRSQSQKAGETQSKRRITLDKTDLQNMRDHKLDPANKSHVALYAREKMQLSQ